MRNSTDFVKYQTKTYFKLISSIEIENINQIRYAPIPYSHRVVEVAPGSRRQPMYMNGYQQYLQIRPMTSRYTKRIFESKLVFCWQY